jgi:hypothetical protein
MFTCIVIVGPMPGSRGCLPIEDVVSPMLNADIGDSAI